MTFRSLLLLAIVLCGTIVLGSCGGSEYKFGNQRRLPSLTGNWSINAISGTTSAQYQGTANLGQTNLDLSGTVTGLFTYCGATGLLDAPLSAAAGFNSESVTSYTISGATLQENVTVGGTQLVTLTGSASADGGSMSGSYIVPPGSCSSGDTGTWSASKM